MRRPHLFGLLGVVVVGLVALAIGTRSALKAQQPSATTAPASGEGAFGAMNIDTTMLEPLHVEAPPKTVDELKTIFKLQDKISMNFPNDTPLKDVIQYIRQATIDEKLGFPKGIPIYVDPMGLEDADRTMADTIKFEFEGMRLAKSLRLILRQLSLTYEVEQDGLIFITSTSSDSGKPLSEEEANWHAFDALRSEVRAMRQEIRELRLLQGPRMAPSAGLPKSASQGGGMGGGFR